MTRAFLEVLGRTTRIAAITGAVALAIFASAARANPEIIAEITEYLNDLDTIQGEFVQMAPDRVISEGAYAIRRPGRLSFVYAPPSPVRVIADGFWVAVLDEVDDETVDRFPLRETPLWLFLREDVDLFDSGTVQEVEIVEGQYRITAYDPTGESQGFITLVFDIQPLRLKEWVITDPQGLETRVILRTTIEGQRVDPRLFVIPEPGGEDRFGTSDQD